MLARWLTIPTSAAKRPSAIGSPALSPTAGSVHAAGWTLIMHYSVFQVRAIKLPQSVVLGGFQSAFHSITCRQSPSRASGFSFTLGFKIRETGACILILNRKIKYSEYWQSAEKGYSPTQARGYRIVPNDTLTLWLRYCFFGFWFLVTNQLLQANSPDPRCRCSYISGKCTPIILIYTGHRWLFFLILEMKLMVLGIC